MEKPSEPVEFVSLWSLHTRQVYAYIYSLVGNRHDADDVFQDTSVTLIEKFAEFDPTTSFSAWACRVAYFKSLNHLQSRRTFAHLDEQVLAALDANVHRSLKNGDRRFEALARCLAQLPAQDRKIMNLRYEQEMPAVAVARKLGCTTSNVYKSLSRIHEALRQCVELRLAQEEQRP